MKKTWKCVLAALAVSAVIGGSLVAQTDDGVVVIGKGRKPADPSPAPQSTGAVRLGAAGSGGPVAPPNQVTPASAEALSGGSYGPETIEPSGVPYCQPAGGYRGTQGYGEFASAGSVGYAVSDDPRKILYSVGHRAGDIYGLNEGYTNLGAFVPYYTEADSALWFFNPRLVITDQGRGAVNLGFGHRAYSYELDRVFSFSSWYDYDAGHEGDYSQVGASFAMIGRNMTFRANGNWVVSDDEHAVGQVPTGSSRLLNGMVVQDVIQYTEVAYNQADLEVSTPVPFLERYGFEWGGGAYFLFGGDGDDAVGARARVEAQVTEDLWVNAMFTSDDIFDNNVSINAEFTIPNAPASRWFRRNKVRDSLLATDRRYYRVATDIVSKMATVPVMMDGGAGGVTALRLAVIDPNNPLGATGGTGTEDDPFRSLLDYTEESTAVKDDYAIIYVLRRVDGTDANLDTTITLLDRQALLGEGIAHSLTNLGLSSITLPGSTDGLSVPLLTNHAVPGTNVVTLANANQVAGFTIDAGGTADGIVGIGIDGFSINNNTIQNVNNGIQIVSDTTGSIGTNRGIIQDNIISGIIPTSTSLSSSTRGISIEHTAGTLDLFVNWNTVSNFRGEDRNSNGVLDLSEDTIIVNGKLDPGEDKDFDGILDPSEDLNADGLLDRGFGIYVTAAGTSVIRANDPAGLADRSISENTLTSNGTGASVIALDSSYISLDFFDNVATGSTGADSLNTGKLALGGTDDPVAAGFRFVADGGRIDITRFTGNSATGGAGTGAIFQTFSGGILTVSNPLTTAFTGNTFTGNALDGMFVEADSGAILFDQVAGSVFNSNGDDGLDLQTTGGGSLVVTAALTGNTYTGNTDNGIELTGGLGGMLSVDIGSATATSSPITGNGGSGIVISTDGGTLMTSLFGVTSSNNGESGVVIHADGGDIFVDGIAGNVFRLNGENGLEIIADNGGSVITPFVGSAGTLLPASAGVSTGSFSNDFALNGAAGLFLGGSNDTLGSTTGLIDLGSVTLNRFQMQGEDIDSDGRLDVAEPDTNGNGMLDADEDLDSDGHRDVAESVSSAIADGTLNPSQGTEGILIDASDVRITATLTRNAFNGRSPVFNSENPALTETAGSGRGIGGIITGTSTIGGNGGLSLDIGTVVEADANSFTNNGDAHIGLIMGGNTINSIEVDNGVFNSAFDMPGTSDFAGEGIHYILRDTAILTGFVSNSSLSNNAGDGLLIEINGNNDAGNSPTMRAAELNDFMIVDNRFTGNGDDGISIVRTERGQFNDLFINWNTITGNADNGIFIQSFGANQLNLANMRPDSVLISENTITNNGFDGIDFLIGADADLLANLDLNVIDSNGRNGIQVGKQINDAKDSRSITGVWTRNTIRNNGDDGIDLEGLLGNILNDPIAGSMIPIAGAGTFPQYGLVIGDVTINPVGTLSSLGNIITGNAADGVQVTGGGIVTIGNNVIERNGTLTIIEDLNPTDGLPTTPGTGPLRILHAGINIEGPEYENGTIQSSAADTVTVDDLTLRTSFQEVLAFSNRITLNNGDGVEFLVEGGVPSFDFYDFTSDPALFPAVTFDPLDTQTMRLINNEITQNAGRGVDILVRPGDADPYDSDNPATPLELMMAGNGAILEPDAVNPQGVRNNVLGTVTLIGNHIKGNRQEGVYVVTTNDIDTNQILGSRIDPGDNDGTGADEPNGLVGPSVRLNMEMHANEVIANGSEVADFPATGLVVRVGTTDGGFDWTFPGGFATSGFNPEDLNGDGILDNDLDGDGYLDSVEPVFGGIAMSVTHNLFDGNFGDDILFHSFRSTVNPVTSAGTWTGPTFDMMTGMITNPGMFTIMAYQSDPLSRLDLIFTENRFNSVEANNLDATVATFDEPGAYYNNAEAVFKSRIIMPMNTAPGPFVDGARGRNATRLASRYLTGPFPLDPNPANPPDFGQFLYPGMGNSTFRVRGGDNYFTDQGLTVADGVSPVSISEIFIMDTPADVGATDLVDAEFEAHGVLFILGPVPGSNGQLPWGWGDLIEIPSLPPVVLP